MGNDARRADKRHLCLPADQIDHCGRRAFVRHVHHVDARHGLEKFGREVSRRAVASRRIRELPWPCFRVSDQFFDRVNGQGGMHDDHAGNNHEYGNRREILQHVVREFRYQARVDCIGGRAH